MSIENRNIDEEVSPHFDGSNENIINDPTSTQGQQMGIKMDISQETVQKSNPFHLTPKTDEDMKEFEQLMRGKKVEIEE